MKRTIFAISMLILVAVFPVYGKNSLSLEDFDRDVLAARRYMRSYCAQIQSAIKSNDDQTAQKSLADIKQAGKLWKNIQNKYAKNPPKEYAPDARFVNRLKTFQLLLDEMAYNVEQKKYQMSFNNCAFACGLFVQMHEENNLLYVSDRLFHLRKAIKKASALNAAGQPLKEVLLEIQKLRDLVYQAPFPEKISEFNPAMEKLSLSIDRMVYFVYNNNMIDPTSMLNELTAQVNALYGLSL